MSAGTHDTLVYRLAYVANRDSNNVSVYTINPASGALTAGAMVAAGSGPRSVTTTAGYTAPTTMPLELTGLWWNENESGWGMSLTQQGSMVFAAWYTYDQTGKPAWYVMSSCPVVGSGCTGDIYSVSGGTPLGVTWNGNGKAVTKVGTGALTFADNNTGAFSYSLNGVSGTKNITRQMFATGTSQPVIDYSALWWNENESGWGIAITQQYGMIFATMYTYDASGNPIWYVASSCPLSGNGCTGDLYKVSGGSMPTVAWNGANMVVTKVGTVSFVFNDSSTGTMSYTIDGVAGSKAITRQLFGTDGNATPVANAGSAQNVAAGTVVTLDGSASSDADGDTLTYAWSLTTKPTGSMATLAQATSVKPTFTPDVAGSYVITLIVNDGLVDSAAATVTTVTAAAATATAARFTKIDSFGNNLPATATNWSCVLDTTSRLLWEVKTDDGGLRDQDWVYTAYEETGTNGNGVCDATKTCNQSYFRDAVNVVGLCGYRDWRLPSVYELESLQDSSQSRAPFINTQYFPYTKSGKYWTRWLSYDTVWWVDFATIYSASTRYKDIQFHVRLVRP